MGHWVVWGWICSHLCSGLAIAAEIALTRLLTLYPTEISLPKSEEINRQGPHPYCSYYALSTFLELWKNGQDRKQRSVSLDPAFVAMAYNAHAGNGGEGVVTGWLLALTNHYGIVPKRAIPASPTKLPWPLPDWRQSHQELLPEENLKELLSAKFTHPTVANPFSGREYLQDHIGVDFTKFALLITTHREPYLPWNEKSTRRISYREGGLSEAAQRMQTFGSETRFELETAWENPKPLVGKVVDQLYQDHPALLNINTDITQKDFSSYSLIGDEDLVENGKGMLGQHMVVAVAHCDTVPTRDPICALFADELSMRGGSDCIAIQNSWGKSAHADGYACLSRSALYRILLSAVVLKTLGSAQE